MIDHHLLDSIKQHEGFRDKAYQDIEGVWTVGYGTNLQELRVSREWAEMQLRNDIEVAISAALAFPEYEYLDTRARRNVFIEMIYNMGPRRVAGFKNMLAAIRRGAWDEAADEMLDSRWAEQVGRRARVLAVLMRTGAYET